MNKSIKIFRSRKKSFGHAFDGLKILFSTQTNARIHIIIAVLVVLLSILLKLAVNEWLYVVILVGFVLFAEAMNTSIEKIVDLVSPEYHLYAKQAKDLGAAAVLIAAITAVVAGTLIFFPKIQLLLPF